MTKKLKKTIIHFIIKKLNVLWQVLPQPYMVEFLEKAGRDLPIKKCGSVLKTLSQSFMNNQTVFHVKIIFTS